MNRSPEHKIDSLAREAEVYFSSGDYLKALKAGREILGLDPESALGHGLAGRAHLGLRQFAESRQHFEKALSFDPTESSRHYFIAVAHRYLGSFKKAEEHIRKAIELDPQVAVYWYQLGCLCHDQDDPDGARRYAKKALELDSSNADALNLLGIATSDETPEGAQEKLEILFRALENDPENPYVHNNIGRTYLRIGDCAGAEDHIRNALAIDPTERLFRTNLYTVLKNRSVVYRVLRAPEDFIRSLVLIVSDNWWQCFLILLVPCALARMVSKSVWTRPIVFMLAPLALWIAWYVTVLPLIRFYEFLTLSDIKSQAREVGARRGGPLGIHGWPFWARFLLFFLAMCGVWTAIGLALVDPGLRAYIIGLLIAGVAATIILGWVGHFSEKRREKEVGERRRIFRPLERSS